MVKSSTYQISDKYCNTLCHNQAFEDSHDFDMAENENRFDAASVDRCNLKRIYKHTASIWLWDKNVGCFCIYAVL